MDSSLSIRVISGFLFHQDHGGLVMSHNLLCDSSTARDYTVAEIGA